MKNIFKTIICITVCFLIVVVVFLVRAKITQKQIDKGTKLSNTDPVVVLLEERILRNNELRIGNLEFNTLTDEELLHYALYALEEDEYSIKEYKNDAGLCIVPDSVMFSTNLNCKIKITTDEYIKNKILDLFGETRDLEFEDFEYKEYTCKHDGEKLYCLINPDYKNKSVSYATLYEACEKKDDIYIYDYYLNINLTNKTKCLKYYKDEICNDPLNSELPTIEDEKIVKNGTLYKHTFTKKDDKYYLTKSEVIK